MIGEVSQLKTCALQHEGFNHELREDASSNRCFPVRREPTPSLPDSGGLLRLGERWRRQGSRLVRRGQVRGRRRGPTSAASGGELVARERKKTGCCGLWRGAGLVYCRIWGTPEDGLWEKPSWVCRGQVHVAWVWARGRPLVERRRDGDRIWRAAAAVVEELGEEGSRGSRLGTPWPSPCAEEGSSWERVAKMGMSSCDPGRSLARRRWPLLCGSPGKRDGDGPSLAVLFGGRSAARMRWMNAEETTKETSKLRRNGRKSKSKRNSASQKKKDLYPPNEEFPLSSPKFFWWLLACRNLKLENLLVDRNGDLKCRGVGYWFAAGCGICSGNDVDSASAVAAVPQQVEAASGVGRKYVVFGLDELVWFQQLAGVLVVSAVTAGQLQVAGVSLWECWPAVAVATELLMRSVDLMKFKVQPFCCVPILPSMPKIDICLICAMFKLIPEPPVVKGLGTNVSRNICK
ncbi:hypothetical protein MLD38_029199 [Melastoma candidum]|uniref:Uncharacterized protein n=1 Tax=Melastoma candidum TaxID=119954 RepID=A0ACB9N4Q4_9MYRT|nr:hypothetical protein MLD38_029199 [Melastoma candidum]